MENDRAIAFFNDQIKKLQDNITQMHSQVSTNLVIIQAFKNEVKRLNKNKNK